MNIHRAIMFLQVLCLTLILLDPTQILCAASDQSNQPNRPNVVIFIADDLGIGDVGCFGNDTIRTPNIDRIAREGVRLTHHLAAEALCTPSRAALMTGRYPIRSGMSACHRKRVICVSGMSAWHRMRVIMHTSSSSGLPANETTIAEAAKQVGYSTALIGKWHLGVHCGLSDLYCHHPLNQGFDHYYGIPLTNVRDFGSDGHRVITAAMPLLNPVLISITLGGAILVWFLVRWRMIGWCVGVLLALFLMLPPMYVYVGVNAFKLMNSMVMRGRESVEQPIDFDTITGRLVGEGVGFLERRKAAGAEGEPFLLVMSWLQVHTVLHASASFRGRSAHGAYGDNVEEMDWSVGRVLDALDRLGLASNTLVYFTSDNGGHLEEREGGRQEGGWNGIYRGGKGQGGMDGGIRVPTVAMWPGHIPPGTNIDVPTTQMDLLPTLMGVWRQPLPPDRVIDGHDIYPLLTGGDNSPPHRFLFHYCGVEIHSARYTPDSGGDVYKVYYYTPNWIPGTFECHPLLCYCEPRYTLFHSPPLLYNIGQDPAEIRPLDTTDPAHARIVGLVAEAVEQHRSEVDRVPDQFSVARLVPQPWLLHCCNFPFCSCKDDASGIGTRA